MLLRSFGLAIFASIAMFVLLLVLLLLLLLLLLLFDVDDAVENNFLLF
jgi:hypothetical protein